MFFSPTICIHLMNNDVYCCVDKIQYGPAIQTISNLIIYIYSNFIRFDDLFNVAFCELTFIFYHIWSRILCYGKIRENHRVIIYRVAVS